MGLELPVSVQEITKEQLKVYQCIAATARMSSSSLKAFALKKKKKKTLAVTTDISSQIMSRLWKLTDSNPSKTPIGLLLHLQRKQKNLIKI
jgi:hypothetical protein